MQESDIKEGRYLYCIINSGVSLNLGKVGIEDNEVYTVPYKDISAVVHVCQAKPYITKDDEKAKSWIFAHNYVIDKVMEQFGTVLPFSFNVIMKGDDDMVKDWLSKNYEQLKLELERVRDKAEYTVRIFYDQDKFIRKILDEDKELRTLREKIEKMPQKAAYLVQRKFELMLKDTISIWKSKLAKEFHQKIKEHAEEIIVEENPRVLEKYKGKELILAISCLVHKDKVEELSKILEEIINKEYTVYFSGPWAPYSFIKLREM